MSLPTLRQLEFLCAIAREGSFSRAAEACHVTQPTLSSAIKELETLLGVQLIEREARGASMTHAGAEIVARAESVLTNVEDLVFSARQASEPLRGPFRLGAIPTIAPYLLPSLITSLRQAHPELKLFLREEQTDRLIEDIRARRLDAALIALPWQAPGIQTRALCHDEFLLVAPLSHDLLDQPALYSDDLLEEDVLLLEDGHCLREHTLSVCQLPANRQRSDITATSLPTLIHMVAGGLGVSLLPRLAVEGGATNGIDVSLRPFSDPVIGRTIGIAWRVGSPRAAEAQMIGQTVQDILEA
ncbi:MAG: LysR substrate-binding domain-containing protein [Henriciella sp.]